VLVVGAPTRLFSSFLSGVERAPLRPAVNRVGLDDEPAVGADALAVFLVVDDVAVALRTAQRLVSLFRFLLVCLCSGATPRVCSRSLMAKPLSVTEHGPRAILSNRGRNQT